MYRFRFVGWLTLTTYRPLILTIGKGLIRPRIFLLYMMYVSYLFSKKIFWEESDRSPPSISF